MRKFSWGIIATAFCMVVLAFVSADAAPLAAKGEDEQKKADPHYYAQMASDIVIGNDKATVTMIEYSSLTCPHCAHFAKDVFPGIKENYIDTGKIVFIHRDFPFDEPSLRAAMLARCAGKDRYYTFLKVLFDKQESWAYQKNYLEVLGNIGKLGGISSEKFDSCMKDKKLEDAIVEGKLTAANMLGVISTPTFFINGKEYKGVNNTAYFAKILDEALAAKK